MSRAAVPWQDGRHWFNPSGLTATQSSNQVNLSGPKRLILVAPAGGYQVYLTVTQNRDVTTPVIAQWTFAEHPVVSRFRFRQCGNVLDPGARRVHHPRVVRVASAVPAFLDQINSLAGQF